MGVLLTLLALGHPWPRAPGSRFRHPWRHRAPKALQQHPHPMSHPTASVGDYRPMGKRFHLFRQFSLTQVRGEHGSRYATPTLEKG